MRREEEKAGSINARIRMASQSSWDTLLNYWDTVPLSTFASQIAQIKSIVTAYGGIPPMTESQLDHLKNCIIAHWAGNDQNLISSYQSMTLLALLTDPGLHNLSYDVASVFFSGYTPPQTTTTVPTVTPTVTPTTETPDNTNTILMGIAGLSALALLATLSKK